MANPSEFVRQVYEAGIRAGLSDTAARVAASQAALETGYGRSVKGNNYFGVKAGSSWGGPTQTFTTHEEVNGKRVKIKDTFRAYDNPEDSLKDWAALMQRAYPDVLGAKSFDQAVTGLLSGKYGAYATDSKYRTKLNNINESYGPKGDALAAINKAAPIPQSQTLMGYAPTPRPTLSGSQPAPSRGIKSKAGSLFGGLMGVGQQIGNAFRTEMTKPGFKTRVAMNSLFGTPIYVPRAPQQARPVSPSSATQNPGGDPVANALMAAMTPRSYPGMNLRDQSPAAYRALQDGRGSFINPENNRLEPTRTISGTLRRTA